MIGYVMIGTNGLDRGTRFYDAVLSTIGLLQVEHAETYTAHAPKALRSSIEIYTTTPFDCCPAAAGNGTMVAFAAPTLQALEDFRTAGLECGGIDEGAAGRREDGNTTFHAYIRDFDDNKISAFYYEAKMKTSDD